MNIEENNNDKELVFSNKKTLRNSIDDATTCLICLNTIQNSSMCPKCSRSVCESCIESWLQKNKSCPHCRETLTKNEIIKNTFMDDIIKLYSSKNYPINKEKEDVYATFPELTCNIHTHPQEYYCLNCNHFYCSDCVIFSHDKSHFLINKKDISIKELDEIVNLSIQIDTCIEYYKNDFPKLLDEKLKEFNMKKQKQLDHLKKLKLAIDTKYTLINESIIDLKKKIEPKISKLLEEKNKIFKIFYNNSLKEKKKRIEIETDVIKEELNKENLKEDIDDVLKPKIKTFLFPYEFQMASYEISNYRNIIKERKKENELIESPIMMLNFLSWKIKIYPWGIGENLGKSLSIFIVLTDGNKDEKYSYTFKLELVNFNGNKNYITTAFSDFKVNFMTGYNNFYDLDEIEKNGFINSKGNILINFYVKPMSSEEFTKELDYYNKKYAKKK